MKELDVWFYGQKCGRLSQDDAGKIAFSYSAAWLDQGDSCPLSASLPLRDAPYTDREASSFFSGILPEAGSREVIARNLGLSPLNDFSLLEAIGGECAGAISILPAGAVPLDSRSSYRVLTKDDLARVLRSLPSRPLLAGEDGVRLSLAGGQAKLALKIERDAMMVPLDGSPSTHIIKPDPKDLPGVVRSEAFCMNLARQVGLEAAACELRQIDGIEYLAVQRYDRILTEEGLTRLHQEDFCQALSVPATMKYQVEGGPSIKDCFALVRRVSSVPVIDVVRLLDAVTFNLLIGNNDAHAKNFSMLWTRTSGRRAVRLAPLYDLLSTSFFPSLTKRMAMKIGSEYDPEKILARHIESMAEESGLSPSLALRRASDLADRMLDCLAHEAPNAKSEEVREHIEARVKRLMKRIRAKPELLHERPPC